MIDQVIIAAQFTGLAVFAIAAGVAVLGAYALLLKAHRWLIGRGWLS